MKAFTILMLAAVLIATVSAKNYYFFGTAMNWHGAFLDCKARGLQLATIMSEEQQLALKALMISKKFTRDMWISGTDLAQEGKFVWASTGKPFEYTHWAPGQPNNSGNKEHCAHIWTNRVKDDPTEIVWNDSDCTEKKSYVCETRAKNCKCINPKPII